MSIVGIPLERGLAVLQQSIPLLLAQGKATAKYLWDTQRHWIPLVLVPLGALVYSPIQPALRIWKNPGNPLAYQLLIPIGALVLSYVRRNEIRQTYEELKALFPDPRHPKRRGNESLLLLGIALGVMAIASALPPLAVLSLIVLIAGIIYLLYGPFFLRSLKVPLGYLLLMVPPPQSLIGTMTQGFQSISASFSGQVLQVLRLPVQIRGTYLILPNRYALEVDVGYSGLTVALPALCLMILIGLLRRLSLGVTLVLLIFVGAISVVLNMVRIVSLGLIGSASQQMVERLHTVAAWPFAALACWLAWRIGRRLMRRRMTAEVA